jgi:molybdopterin-guanine dinucleotide biosynthesis adapter protein
MLRHATVPVLGFAAYSGTGKTTLLRKLIPLLRARDLRLGVVKHAHHSFDIDRPGKDSYELRKAGAVRMLIASRRRWALVVETDGSREPTLEELLVELNPSELDLVLVEGFKHEAFRKIELHRPALGHPLIFPGDRSVVAVATDAPLGVETSLPILDINQPEQLAEFIVQRLHAWRGQSPARR